MFIRIIGEVFNTATGETIPLVPATVLSSDFEAKTVCVQVGGSAGRTVTVRDISGNFAYASGHHPVEVAAVDFELVDDHWQPYPRWLGVVSNKHSMMFPFE